MTGNTAVAISEEGVEWRKMPILRKKHKKFLDEYFLNGFNAGLAYSTVYQDCTRGSASTLGSRLLKHPAVELEYMKRSAEIARSQQIDKSIIIKTLNKIVSNFNETNSGAREAMRAVELLGKMAGFFPKEAAVVNNIDNQVTVSFAGDFTPEPETIAANSVEFKEVDVELQDEDDNEDL